MDAETTPQKAPEVSPRETDTEALPAVKEKQSEAAGEAPAITIAGHPRAVRLVRRSREAAGLGGFLVAGWMSMSTHSLGDTLLRAIAAGAACQVIVWAAAVFLCRHLITAELRNREHALMGAALRAREARTAAPGQALAGAAPARGNQA